MMPQRVHVIGIGGIGLSAIAQILLARGIEVSGSDLRASPITDKMTKLGAKIFIGHRAENVGDAEFVLVTSAAPRDNPEVQEARRRGIRIATRYNFFPQLTAGKTTIAIAGTHGKTTTTGMIAMTLVDAGLDPDVIVGGIVPEMGGNARTGRGRYFVVEADEYDRAFLGLRPAIAVVTSIEMDHPDIFADASKVEEAFHEFVNLVPRDGMIAGCGDAVPVTRVLQRATAQTVRYGFDMMNDWRATDVRQNSIGGNDFTVWRGRERVRDFSLRIPGRHNVLNALAVLSVADRLGIDLVRVHESLRRFRGASRRFEVKGDFGGVTIIDDYAHHPTEIRATLEAARGRYPDRDIWAVFQPHTYSRTLALLDDFAQAFSDADHVVITEIFAARELEAHGLSGKRIVEHMKHRDARFAADLDESVVFLAKHLRAGDVLITLGAGDVYRVAEVIAQQRQGA